MSVFHVYARRRLPAVSHTIMGPDQEGMAAVACDPGVPAVAVGCRRIAGLEGTVQVELNPGYLHIVAGRGADRDGATRPGAGNGRGDSNRGSNGIVGHRHRYATQSHVSGSVVGPGHEGMAAVGRCLGVPAVAEGGLGVAGLERTVQVKHDLNHLRFAGGRCADRDSAAHHGTGGWRCEGDQGGARLQGRARLGQGDGNTPAHCVGNVARPVPGPGIERLCARTGEGMGPGGGGRPPGSAGLGHAGSPFGQQVTGNADVVTGPQAGDRNR